MKRQLVIASLAATFLLVALTPIWGQGVYGPPAGQPSASINRLAPLSAAPAGWADAPFFFIQTELSPATLYHSKTSSLRVFANMADVQLGAPTFAAIMTANGPRIIQRGQPIDAAAMSENWILVWWAGAQGFADWDSPWVAFLQRKPTSMRFDDSGIAMTFAGQAGDVVLMSLYGYYKPPQQGKEPFPGTVAALAGIRTWTWANGLPADVVERIRYWSRVSREFPLYCQDSFSVDRANDSVIIRQTFSWRSINDDWNTPHLKLAPLSPPLAQASMDGGFPVAFSARVVDPEYFTQYGPYMGVEGVDSFDSTFRILQYVNETEASDPANVAAHPNVATALERLRQTAREKFSSPDVYKYDHGGMNNFCWSIMGDVWYAKALPYYDPQTQANAKASLRKYFSEDVLVRARFIEREYPRGSGLTYLILEGPGIGSWGVLGDAGKFSTNMLETIWAYAHYTGDWELIKERWPLIKRLFCTAAETRWVTFARGEIAEMGDEAAPCIAFARLAYRVGDMDTYNYACYMVAREFVHHYLKSRGAAYFQQRQPWHTMEAMHDEVYLTNFWGDVASWQIDGPTWPVKYGERQHTNRWVRFKNEDVARFYRDRLQEDVRKEMDLLTARWPTRRDTAGHIYRNDSHIMPSMVQLRSLLLNETPEQLARIAPPEKWASGSASGMIANCMSVIRVSRPTRFERLIPADGQPSPFVAGLEREKPEASTYLAMAVESRLQTPAGRGGQGRAARVIWPRPTWWGWQTASRYRWGFGQIVPAEGQPTDARTIRLSWNTAATVYTMP